MKELVENLINNLLYSWGGDTPQEAYWIINGLVSNIEELTNTNCVKLKEFDEHTMQEEWDKDYEEVINYLAKHIKIV